jgi:hypothetical protein
VHTEITKRSDGVLITTGISTTAAVGGTAKTSMELLISMRVSEERGIDKVTSLFDYTQSFARNKARYALLLSLIYKQFH